MPLRDAAVLITVIEAPGMAHSLVFIRRSRHGRHGDQIAFPGGPDRLQRWHAQAAALREFEEEVGVDRNEVEPREALPAMTRPPGSACSR